MMMGCNEDTMMLCSTTGPYRRHVIEVAYGEMIFHFTEAVWEMIAWEEWLGCQHDASPMFDIPGSTLVWVSYLYYFPIFIIQKAIYIILKAICSIKKH